MGWNKDKIKHAHHQQCGTKVSVRPSGTEPKIKFYLEVKGEMKRAQDFPMLEEKAMMKIEAIKKSLGLNQ